MSARRDAEITSMTQALIHTWGDEATPDVLRLTAANMHDQGFGTNDLITPSKSTLTHTEHFIRAARHEIEES